jgi:predicted nucleic acid-binding protein
MSGNGSDPLARVLDTWAVIAWLRDEPAAARIDRLWSQATAGRIRLLMNAVNLGEVFYITARWRSLPDAELVLRQLQEMPLEVCAAPNALIWEAARLKALYRLAYADAFAVATAVREQAPLVTGDPEMRALAERGVIRLEWVRE